jgi:fumarate reductase subunit D
MGSAHTVARRARAATKRTAANPALEMLERAGYVVRGVLYATMGGLALGLALGIGGNATDQSGSLVLLTQNGAGRVVLLVVIACLAAYALWGFVRAIFDPLHRGDDPPGVAERLGFAWSGIAYTSVVLFALKLLIGSSPSHRDSTQAAIASILALPAGKWLAIGIGLVAIGVGLGQFVEAYKATFKTDLKRGEMKEAEKRIVDDLGRVGMVSRGVTFSLVGWFVLQGGLHQDVNQVHGYGGAFVFILGQPFGHALLAAVALGFIALGLHSFACARWLRLLSEE